MIKQIVIVFGQELVGVMLCRKPYMMGVLPFRCGNCDPCRVNRRRIWTHRIYLESFKHGDSCFVTLTYDNEHLPKGGSLERKDVQKWLKRLRQAFKDVKIRYFLVGEYGDRTFRPHYHVALYGIGVMASDVIGQTWGKGGVFVGDLTRASASYIGGYVTKKMTKGDDPRLNGRYPEFCRMSLKPGIGYPALDDVKKVLTSEYGNALIVAQGDVPMSLKHGRSSLPLGRYLRRKLRGLLGLSEDSPKEAQKQWALQMRGMFEEAFKHAENAGETLGGMAVKLNSQKILNVEARAKISNGRTL